MRLHLSIGCLCLCLGADREAYAEEQPTVALVYSRADDAQGCPDAQSTSQGVAARLGRHPFDPQSERKLTVRLEARGQGYSVDIIVRDSEGEIVGQRALSTKQRDCNELASAMQLAIAIAIDPLHNMPTPAPVPGAESEPPPGPVVETPPAPPAPPPRSGAPAPPPPKMKIETSRYVGGGLLIARSTEPNPSIGLTLQYGHRDPYTAWAMEARIDKPSEISAMSGQVQTSLFSGSLLLCLRPQNLEVCALASIGNLWGSGSGYQESKSFQTPYGAAGLRMGHLFSVHQGFGIELSGDLLGRFNTTTLLVDDEEVWSSGRLEFGLGARALWRIE